MKEGAAAGLFSDMLQQDEQILTVNSIQLVF